VKIAENRGENAGCPCEGRLETESNRGARSGVSPEGTEGNGAGSLLAKVLDKENLNRAYKRVVDRLIQLAIAQILEPIFEPEFSDGSYGFRPGRSAHQAIRKARKYYDGGYRQVVVDIDLAKYFDTINHDLLINMLREKIKDESLLSLIRKCLKSGVMLNGVHIPTADMSKAMKELTEWVRRRIRMYIWKQWRRIRTRFTKLQELGVSREQAFQWSNTRKSYWRTAGSWILSGTLTNERLANLGFENFSKRYEALHSSY